MERGNFFVMLCTQGGGYAPLMAEGRHCEVRDGRGAAECAYAEPAMATTSDSRVYDAWRRLGL